MLTFQQNKSNYFQRKCHVATKHTGEIDQYLTSIHQSTTQDNEIDNFWITKMSKGFSLWSRVGRKGQFFRNLVVDPHMFSQVTRLDKRLGASWTLITNTKIMCNTPYPLRNTNFEWNVWYSPGQECFLSPVCVAVWRCKWDFCMNALPQNWQTKSFFPWNEKQKIFGALMLVRVLCIVTLVNQRCGSGSGKQPSASGQHRIQNGSDPKDW